MTCIDDVKNRLGWTLPLPPGIAWFIRQQCAMGLLSQEIIDHLLGAQRSHENDLQKVEEEKLRAQDRIKKLNEEDKLAEQNSKQPLPLTQIGERVKERRDEQQPPPPPPQSDDKPGV